MSTMILFGSWRVAGSTGREWCFFKLPRDDSRPGEATVLPLDKAESKQQNRYSPFSGNMLPIQDDSDVEMEIEQADGNIQEEEERKLTGTKVYKCVDVSNDLRNIF
jgi:hypothetical protein